MTRTSIENGVVTPTKYALTIKPLIDFSKADPIENQWYTVLDVRGGGELKRCYFSQENTPTSELHVQVQITRDGIVGSAGNDYPSGTGAYAYSVDDTSGYGSDAKIVNGALNVFQDATATEIKASIPMPFHTLKIEVRLHDPPAVGQIISCQVKYALLEVVP